MHYWAGPGRAVSLPSRSWAVPASGNSSEQIAAQIPVILKDAGQIKNSQRPAPRAKYFGKPLAKRADHLVHLAHVRGEGNTNEE